MAALPLRTSEISVSAEDRDLSFFRRAHGQNLGRLCAAMSVVAERNPGIELPLHPRTKEISPRVVLVKSKEIKRNSGLRKISATLKRDTAHCLSDIPSPMKSSRIVVAENLDVHKSSRGEYFLSLLFNPDNAEELGEERADLWYVFEDLQRSQDAKELDWKTYDPNMRLVYADETVAPRTVMLVAQYISNHLPLPISLEPVFKPNTP